MNKHVIKFLRGFSHDLKPVVMVADKGLTENVMNEIDIALDRHELIKIKIRVDRETREKYIAQIIEETKATKIQGIGQTLSIFRRNPKDPQFEIPE
jgi:RNA-binding protein